MHQSQKGVIYSFVSTISNASYPREKTVTGDQMKRNPLYMSMNIDQRHYSDGQFWFGAAIGIVVSIPSIIIGIYYMA